VVDTVQQVTLEMVVQVDRVVEQPEDLLLQVPMAQAVKEMQVLLLLGKMLDQHHSTVAVVVVQVRQLPIM
jgi:hypothetical protein